MGQYSDILQAKLEGVKGFSTLWESANRLALIKEIRDILFNFQDQKYAPQALHEAKQQFYIMLQGKTSTPQMYFEQFQIVVDVLNTAVD